MRPPPAQTPPLGHLAPGDSLVLSCVVRHIALPSHRHPLPSHLRSQNLFPLLWLYLAALSSEITGAGGRVSS